MSAADTSLRASVGRWIAERRAEHAAVAEEFAQVNIVRLRVVCAVIAVVAVAHIAIFSRPVTGASALQHQWRGAIVTLHTALATLSVALAAVAHGLARRAVFDRWAKAFVVLSSAILLFFGLAFATVDQWVTPSITPLLLSAIAVATLLRLRPSASISMLVLHGAIAQWTLSLTQHDAAQLLSNRVNTWSVASIAAVLAVVLWRSNTKATLLQRALEATNAELDRRKVELSTLNRELEARIDEKAKDLIEKAEEVHVLAAQLQQRIEDRSNELARALTSTPVDQRAPLTIGATLNQRVRLIANLGQGGMGSVFLGEDLASRKQVAVKVVQHHALSDAQALHRFLRESRAAARVEHDAVARMLHIDVTSDGVLFQIQELVDGRTLSELFKLRIELGVSAAFSQMDCARMGSVLADALRVAHASGVVHRDIKPGNVMLTAREPGLKLLDFGVAKLAEKDGSTTASHEIVGTPDYMAPEQILTPSLVDDRSDVYALGLLLYRMISGTHAFVADTPNAKMRAQLVADPGPLCPSIDPELARLVMRCLSKEARLRPSAFELSAVLRAISDRLGAPSLSVIARRLLEPGEEPSNSPRLKPTLPTMKAVRIPHSERPISQEAREH